MIAKRIKVVSILSPFKVVINVGSKDGIRPGQRLIIYGLSTEAIKDPDTREDLGKVEIVRGRGIVTHVQEKISTVESIEKETSAKRVVKSSGRFQALINQPEEETVYNDSLKPFDEVQIRDYAEIEE